MSKEIEKNNKNKSKNFSKTLKRIIKMMFKANPIAIIVIILFSITSVVFSILGPKILGGVTTELFTGLLGKIKGTGGIDFAKIANISIIVITLYILSALFSFIQNYIMSTISQNTIYRLRKKISKKINKLPVSYFEKRTIGEVLSTITNDLDIFGQGLNDSLTQIITNSVTIIGITVIMFTISPLLTIIALILIPISGMTMGTIVKGSQKYFIKAQEELAKVNGQVEESYAGYNIIAGFNHQEKSLNEFKIKNETLYKSALKSQFLSSIMYPIISVISNIGYIAIVILGGVLVSNGTIQIGDVQAFIQYIRQFTMPMGQLAQAIATMQGMTAAAERVYEFLDEEEETEIPKVIKNKNEVEKMIEKGNVEFKNVEFGYREGQTVIKNFNVKVEKGQTIAIVGPTGGGKTTLVKLLMRFYELNSGEILIDGENIKNLNRHDLRDYFTMVLQDTWLFNGTIMENLRYGNLNATDEEVIDAAKAAHIHHYIMTLKDGYNTVLNEDTSNISGGQKQLLTIARSILADKPILILDEATSNVDTRTEIQIQEAMNKLMEGRTSFVIAHRLSTIKNADKILVLKDGDIFEQGNHEELINKNGFYAELYKSQFEN